MKSKENSVKAVCISASNMLSSNSESTSMQISKKIEKVLGQNGIPCNIVDLRTYNLNPCIGCGKCFHSKRCCRDDAFNAIYEEVIQSDCIFFVSPHYAPIPAKLSMLLEKMEEITFLHWWKDNSYRSEVYNLPTGIVSHGGGSDWALASYKAMVNDTIANALDTIQCRVVPYNSEWNTGISIPVYEVKEENDIFPKQTYDWKAIEGKIQEYVNRVLQVTEKQNTLS